MVQKLRKNTGVNPHVSVIFRAGYFFYLITFTYQRRGITYQVVFLPENEQQSHEYVDQKVKYSHHLQEKKHEYQEMKYAFYQEMEEAEKEQDLRRRSHLSKMLDGYKQEMYEPFKNDDVQNASCYRAIVYWIYFYRCCSTIKHRFNFI
jgi:endo-1,4-beta-D-glucanase Y